MSFWNGVLWQHLLAMPFFVGGQLMPAAIFLVSVAIVWLWDRCRSVN